MNYSESFTFTENIIVMIVNCVYVHVRSDSVDRFLEATIVNHQESVKEKGNLRFDLIQQSDDPCRFLIYEAYDSDEAAAAHKNTRHYIAWRDTVKDIMAEPRKGVKYNIIVPEDISRW
jgi:(4S)-4-hydroxy-5-phosphonooxypentane-2,3-dione isomerase